LNIVTSIDGLDVTTIEFMRCDLIWSDLIWGKSLRHNLDDISVELKWTERCMRIKRSTFNSVSECYHESLKCWGDQSWPIRGVECECGSVVLINSWCHVMWWIRQVLICDCVSVLPCCQNGRDISLIVEREFIWSYSDTLTIALSACEGEKYRMWAMAFSLNVVAQIPDIRGVEAQLFNTNISQWFLAFSLRCSVSMANLLPFHLIQNWTHDICCKTLFSGG
jgi:hypothetical protein